jgi:hypothetical protein
MSCTEYICAGCGAAANTDSALEPGWRQTFPDWWDDDSNLGEWLTLCPDCVLDDCSCDGTGQELPPSPREYETCTACDGRCYIIRPATRLERNAIARNARVERASR